MPKPLVVIIAGPPCTGKTTLGKHIAAELHLPFIHKDGIKELLFDTLGWKDRAWSRSLGAASMTILFHFVEIQLRAGQPFIVESNFAPPLSTTSFLELKEQYDFEPFQIQCQTEGQVLFERFKQRAESGERHPGHVDRVSYEEFKSVLLKGKHEVLDIGGTLFEVDTTDFASIDYKKLLDAIRGAAQAL